MPGTVPASTCRSGSATVMAIPSRKLTARIKPGFRERVSRDTGVPASLLTAETEEACKSQAEAIKAFAKPAGYPQVRDGGEVHGSGPSSTRDKFADWMKDNFPTSATQ